VTGEIACRIIAAVVTCTNPTPRPTPAEAVAVLTASVKPWTAPPEATPAPWHLQPLGPDYDPEWHGGRFAPTSAPTAPLAPPWSVTTYIGHGGGHGGGRSPHGGGGGPRGGGRGGRR
jgi:uncharacterized membrane protein YgcG